LLTGGGLPGTARKSRLIAIQAELFEEKSGMDACAAASAASPAQRRPVNAADAAVPNMHLLLQYSCDRLPSIIFFPFSAFGRSARGDEGSIRGEFGSE
jgi:hypothetical protein